MGIGLSSNNLQEQSKNIPIKFDKVFSQFIKKDASKESQYPSIQIFSQPKTI